MSPAVGIVEAGDAVEQRRLADARLADQDDELAGRDAQRHLLEHQRVAIGFGQCADLEHAAIMHDGPPPMRPAAASLEGQRRGPPEPDPRSSLGRAGAPAARFRSWPARDRYATRKTATACTSCVGLLLQVLRRGRALLDQRGVALRGLVHLRHRLADLADAGALLGAGGGDLADDAAHAADRGDDLVHRLAGQVHQRAALVDALDAGGDQGLDLARRFGAALRQAAHLAGHHREAAALFAGARGFDRGVEREDVGLESDRVDHRDDVGDLAAASR